MATHETTPARHNLDSVQLLVIDGAVWPQIFQTVVLEEDKYNLRIERRIMEYETITEGSGCLRCGHTYHDPPLANTSQAERTAWNNLPLQQLTICFSMHAMNRVDWSLPEEINRKPYRKLQVK
jgi:hypothetical protein